MVMCLRVSSPSPREASASPSQTRRRVKHTQSCSNYPAHTLCFLRAAVPRMRHASREVELREHAARVTLTPS